MTSQINSERALQHATTRGKYFPYPGRGLILSCAFFDAMLFGQICLSPFLVVMSQKSDGDFK